MNAVAGYIFKWFLTEEASYLFFYVGKEHDVRQGN